MTLILNGKELAAKSEKDFANRVSKIKDKSGITPILATILVGDDPASETYVKMKGNACERIGMRSLKVELSNETTTEELINKITELNYNNIGFIRFGYRNLFKRDLEQKLSIGCGIALNYKNIKYHIDYSYTDFDILGSPQKLTITFVLR